MLRRPIAALFYLGAALVNGCWLFLGDRLSLWTQVGAVPLTVALAGAGVAIRVGGLRPGEGKRHLRRALWALLGYYLCILSVLLFFGGLFHLDRGYGGTFNLVPFDTIRRFFYHYRRTGSFSSLSNLVGNVVILIPLGVLLPVAFRSLRRWWVFLPLAALFAVGVEAIQWLTATGVADVDDSILNFAGAALGYFLTRLIQMGLGRSARCRERRDLI